MIAPPLARRVPGLPPAVLGPVLAVLGLASMAAHVSSVSVAVVSPIGTWLVGVSILVATSAVISILAAIEGSLALRRAVGSGLLLVFVGVLLARLGGSSQPTWFGPHPAWHQAEPSFVWGLLVVTALALGGVLVHRRWARWLAIALGTAGAIAAGFDLLAGWAAPDAGLWLSSVQVAGCVLVVANFTGDELVQADACSSRDALWLSPSAAVSWLRAAIVSAIVAVPTLLAYAWVQAGLVTSLGTATVLLAIALTVGAIATVRGKTVGAVLLVASGGALLPLTAALVLVGTTSFDHQVASYYAATWLPAAACSIVAGLALLRSIARREGSARHPL